MDAAEAKSMIEEAETVILELDNLGYEVTSAQKFVKLAKAFFQQKNYEKAYEYAQKAYNNAKIIEKQKEEESLRDLKDAYEGSKVSAEELERALRSSTKLGGTVIVEKKNENREESKEIVKSKIVKSNTENIENKESISEITQEKNQNPQLPTEEKTQNNTQPQSQTQSISKTQSSIQTQPQAVEKIPDKSKIVKKLKRTDDLKVIEYSVEKKKD